jgi:hypothetical protein
MNVRKNARLTPRGRVPIIERIAGGQRFGVWLLMQGYRNARRIEVAAVAVWRP